MGNKLDSLPTVRVESNALLAENKSAIINTKEKSTLPACKGDFLSLNTVQVLS